MKASNLLIDSAGTVRISDFGVAGWMDDITSREGKREVGVHVHSATRVLFPSLHHALRLHLTELTCVRCSVVCPDVCGHALLDGA